jgi:hypothetical protein
MRVTRRRFVAGTAVATAAAVGTGAPAGAHGSDDHGGVETVERVTAGAAGPDVVVSEGHTALPARGYPDGLAPVEGDQVVVTDDPGTGPNAQGPGPGAIPLIRSIEVPEDLRVAPGDVVEVAGERFRVLPDTVIEQGGDGRRLAFLTRPTVDGEVPRVLAIVHR